MALMALDRPFVEIIKLNNWWIVKVYVQKTTANKAREKRSKYRNTKCKAGGLSFDSIGERNRYFYLLEMEREGKIKNLGRQIKFPLDVNGIHICDYIADFVYETKDEYITEDFKGGYRLPNDWAIKKKLMLAVHGVEVKIVKSPTEAIK